MAMTNPNLVVRWTADRHPEDPFSDDVEERRTQWQKNESAIECIKSWLSLGNGTLIEVSGTDGWLELVPSALDGLKPIIDQYTKACGCPASVGVAASMSDAERARLVAKGRGGDRILLWSEEMYPELAAIREKSETPEEDDEYGDVLNRSTPEDVWSDEEIHELAKMLHQPIESFMKSDFSQDEMDAVETPTSGGNSAPAYASAGLPPEQPSTGASPGGGDVTPDAQTASQAPENNVQFTQGEPSTHEEAFHQHAQAADADDQASQSPQRQQIKQAVVQVLKQVAPQLKQLESIKDQVPDAYEGVLAVVEAMAAMAQALNGEEPAVPEQEQEEGESGQKSGKDGQKEEKTEKSEKDDGVERHLPRIQQIRDGHAKAVEGQPNPSRICHLVAPDIERQTGLEHVMGTYEGPEVEADEEGDGNYYHEWNEHPDGTIVDATADQFGDENPIRVVKPGSAEYGWYNGGGRGGLDKNGPKEEKTEKSELEKGDVLPFRAPRAKPTPDLPDTQGMEQAVIASRKRRLDAPKKPSTFPQFVPEHILAGQRPLTAPHLATMENYINAANAWNWDGVDDGTRDAHEHHLARIQSRIEGSLKQTQAQETKQKMAQKGFSVIKEEEGETKKDELPAQHFHHTGHDLKLPVGTVNNGKVKVVRPETGKTAWKSVRAGIVMSPDGNATSSRNPNGK